MARLSHRTVLRAKGYTPLQALRQPAYQGYYARVRTSEHGSNGKQDDSNGETYWQGVYTKVIEGAGTAFGSVVILGLAGYSYNRYYKSLVLRKIENAFAAGYSSLEQAALSRHVHTHQAEIEYGGCNLEDDAWVPRHEQALLDKIIDGTLQGQYYLITGEKGTGKTSMLLKAMSKTHGEGVAMFEAHGDTEIFRIRLGKALDYEYHEDYIGSLFSFKGPRDTSAILDVERAFNKMEKYALQRRRRVHKPLVLIINSAHLLRDDENGRDLLELIQQRAELWAASKLVTVVLSCNDYWIEERLVPQASRLQVIPVHDISKESATTALRAFRTKHFDEPISESTLNQVYERIGGRLRLLAYVAKSSDMLQACDQLCEKEKRWLMNHCWVLGNDMDDDAEDQQEYAAAAMTLVKALVDKEKESAGTGRDGKLPQIPLHQARQLMTRVDFIQLLDHANIFSIDPNSMVQADSVAMQNAFRAIVDTEGFTEHLQATIDRLNELESLRRTREVTLKDLNDLKSASADEIHAVMNQVFEKRA